MTQEHSSLAGHQQPPPLNQNGHGIEGVLCYDEYGIQLASRLASSLGLPFLSSATVDQVRNKHSFRRMCTEAGLPAPRFMQVRAAQFAGGAQDAAAQLEQRGIR